MNLTKDQVNLILKNAPAGSDKTKLLDGLIIRGYNLEGVDSEARRKELQSQGTKIDKDASKIQENGVFTKLGENLTGLVTEKPVERAEEIMSSIGTIPARAEQAGGSPLAYGLAVGQTAGNIAGTVARGVGDIIGSVISPFIPEQAQEVIGNVATEINKKIDEIPGMTPELKKSMEDVFDTITLYGGGKGATAAKEFGTTTIKPAITGIGQSVEKTGQQIARTGQELLRKPSQVVEELVQKPIPQQVKTTLNEIKPETFDKYVKAAKEGSITNKAGTALEVAGSAAQDSLDIIQRKLQNIGSSKSAIMDKANVGLKNMGNEALKLRQQIQNYAKDNTLVGGDKTLINDILEKAKKLGSNPKAKEVDKFIDYVQDKVYTSSRDLTIPMTSKTPAFVRSVIGQLNNKLKSVAGKSYSNLNDTYSKLVKIRDELNSKLGKEGERAGSLMKRVFSPSDARTKQLFEQVKKETGIDLVNEATVAKFVMEVFGDARQLSLLEELKIPKIVSNPLDFLWDRATKQFNTPERILERAKGYIKKPENTSNTTIKTTTKTKPSNPNYFDRNDIVPIGESKYFDRNDIID